MSKPQSILMAFREAATKLKEKTMASKEVGNGNGNGNGNGKKLSLQDAKAAFRSLASMNFHDISSEKYRTYVFENGSKVTIKDPLFLNVSKSGGHRVYDARGISHYIPYKWVHLYWESRQGEEHFTL